MPHTSNEDIVPFWLRIREISLYPFRGDALLTIGLLSLCSLATFLPGIGGLLSIAIYVGIYKYAFEVLRNTADGRLDPPTGSMNVEESMGWRAIGLRIGFLGLILLARLILGPEGALLMYILVAFGTPGAYMSLAIDENVWHALNPITWVQIMARLGWPYFLMFGLMLVISASTGNLNQYLSPYLPYVVATLLQYFLVCYGTIATFHLMGYLIYQYHDRVGYNVAPPAPPPRRIDADPDQVLLDRATELVRDGQPEAATALLREQLQSRGGSEALHTQYRKLLRLADDKAELLKHGRSYVSVLLAQDKDKRAVDIARECLDLDPAFSPSEAEDITRVAQQAAKMGQTQIAIRLLSGFHKRFPKSKDIPQNYLLAAKLLHERMNQDAQAKTLLLQLKQAYPQHPLIAEIDERLALIETMAVPLSAAKSGTPST